MFILLTFVTLILLSVFKPPYFEHVLPKHSLLSFTILWYFSWQMLIVYGCWLLAIVNSLFPRDKRFVLLQYLAKFGAAGSLRLLHGLILCGAVFLLIEGWLQGNPAWFVPAVILTAGLLGNMVEQGAIL